MATVSEILEFVAPGLTASAGEKAMAIELAEGYRPACLTQAKADQAVAYYAAWLLYGRQQSAAEGEAGDVAPVGVKSQTDGDLSRTYLTAGEAGQTVSDPAGFYARWDALAQICRNMGSITVGNGFPPRCC